MGDQIVERDVRRVPLANAPLAPLFPAPGAVAQADDRLTLGLEHARDMTADKSVGASHQHGSAHRGLRVPAKLYSRPGNFRKPPRMPSTKSGIIPGSGNKRRAAIRR